jgi:bacterioferritin-associated ferredoxin
VRDCAAHVVAQHTAQPNGAARPDVQAHMQVIEALREQLAIANARADREALKGAIDSLPSQLEREQNRVDRAERLLDEERERRADAIAAERIAAGEAAALRAELDRRAGVGACCASCAGCWAAIAGSSEAQIEFAYSLDAMFSEPATKS